MEKIVALRIDGQLFVDTAFINSCKGILPDSELKHMGFGEFYLETPDGTIQFARRDTLKWNDISGRAHKIYDDVDGVLVKALVQGFEDRLIIDAGKYYMLN